MTDYINKPEEDEVGEETEINSNTGLNVASLHTNDSSDCCIAIIREVDNKEKMKWWTKGNMTAPVIANVIEQVKNKK